MNFILKINLLICVFNAGVVTLFVYHIRILKKTMKEDREWQEKRIEMLKQFSTEQHEARLKIYKTFELNE